MRGTLFALVLIGVALSGCGGGGGDDADGAPPVPDAAQDGDAGVVPLEEVLAAYSAAWGEADPVARMADLQRACAPDVTYVDPTSMSSDLAGLSQVIDSFQTLSSGGSVPLTSGAEAHHGRARFAWRALTGAGGTLVDGMDYVHMGTDGKLAAIAGFWEPLPAPGTLDPPIQSFHDAWNTADPTARDAQLAEALAPGAVFVDPQGGELDAAGLSAEIGALFAADPGVALSFSGFQSYPHGFRIAWDITGATPAHGAFAGSLAADGRIAEVTEFDGDLPPP
jgi:hypothetical protein